MKRSEILVNKSIKSNLTYDRQAVKIVQKFQICKFDHLLGN